MSNYLITYKAKNNRGEVIKSGIFKVKNKQSEFEAKASFENFLKRKVPDFYALEITKPVVNLGSGDILDIFNSIFNG